MASAGPAAFRALEAEGELLHCWGWSRASREVTLRWTEHLVAVELEPVGSRGTVAERAGCRGQWSAAVAGVTVEGFALVFKMADQSVILPQPGQGGTRRL